MVDTTHALMYGELNSVDDIIDAVEQEQDHDERFHSCRVLIREVKRLRERLRDATDLLHDCEYYICPTCNQWADRNYDCENSKCKEADERN